MIGPSLTNRRPLVPARISRPVRDPKMPMHGRGRGDEPGTVTTRIPKRANAGCIENSDRSEAIGYSRTRQNILGSVGSCRSKGAGGHACERASPRGK